MGSEFLIEETSHAHKSCSDTFEELFPYYISIGMSPAEYWDGDASLARYYREAFQHKQEYDDTIAWLNGLYVYDALYVALGNNFGNGRKKEKYSEEPQMMKLKRLKQQTKENAAQQSAAWMTAFVGNHKKPEVKTNDD